MRTFFIISIILTTAFAAKAQSQNASFPGGLDSLYKSLIKKIRYPNSCLEEGLTGCASFYFKLDMTSKKLSFNYATDIYGPFYEEVISIATKNLPFWKPATVKNHLINSIVVLPVCFTMDTTKNKGSSPFKKTSIISNADTLWLDTIIVNHPLKWGY